MKKQYHEIMDNLVVTEEMRARILEHLTDCDLQETSEKHPIRRFPVWGRYLSVAACLALLLSAVRILPGLSFTTQPDMPESLTAVNGITEVSSSAELSAAVGFPVAEVTGLPFTPSEVIYCSYWDEMAQITYSDGSNSALFRQSCGTEDNSGDYNEYADTTTLTLGTGTVLLKGYSDLYTLAIWQDTTYSYSLSLSAGLSSEEWVPLLESIR